MLRWDEPLIVIGILIAGVGLLITLGVPIGRLPGDFTIRRGNFSFYFPLTTSIIVSIVLTLVDDVSQQAIEP